MGGWRWRQAETSREIFGGSTVQPRNCSIAQLWVQYRFDEIKYVTERKPGDDPSIIHATNLFAGSRSPDSQEKKNKKNYCLRQRKIAGHVSWK
jgi:hypothetical protein